MDVIERAQFFSGGKGPHTVNLQQLTSTSGSYSVHMIDDNLKSDDKIF